MVYLLWGDEKNVPLCQRKVFSYENRPNGA